MKNSNEKIFIIVFIILIFSVSVIQAVYELTDKDSSGEIQAFYIFKDLFITPVERINSQDSIIEIIENDLSWIEMHAQESSAQDTMVDVLDNFKYKVKDLQKSHLTKNRYIILDSTAMLPCLAKLDSLTSSLADVVSDSKNSKSDKNEVKLICQRLINQIEDFEENRGGVISQLYDAVFKYVLFSQKYLRKYEGEMEDNSVVSIKTRPYVQYLRYHFYQYAGEKVVIGDDDEWFFYKFGVDYLVRPWVEDPRTKVVDYNDKVLSDDPIKTILEFQEQLKVKNIELLVTIVPGKASVYPDKLNDRMTADEAISFSHTLEVIERLKAKGVNVVDLFEPMKAERKKGIVDGVENDPLYLKSDTHWRLRGLKVAATEVAKRIKEYSWYYDSSAYKMDYITIADTVEREGDVGVMSQLPAIEFWDASKVLPLEQTPVEQVYSVVRETIMDTIYRADSTTIDTIIAKPGEKIKSRKLYKDDFRKSRILVIGDSFSRIYQTDAPRGAGWISHLAFNLGEPVASIVSDGGASTLVRQKLARKSSVLKKKKLVVWEFVERDFRFGADGWMKVDLD